MKTLTDIYRRLQRNRCLLGACYLALGVLVLLAAGTMGTIIKMLLGVIVACAVFALAIWVTGYLVYRGGKAIWQETTGADNDKST